jgi:hypothetical protein
MQKIIDFQKKVDIYNTWTQKQKTQTNTGTTK